MATGKHSFIFYVDWEDTFLTLPDDKAGQLIKHLLAYVRDKNPETDDMLITAVFANIKATLKRDLKKWEKQHRKRKEAGRMGGLARASNAKQKQAMLSKPKQTQANQAVNVTGNGNATVNATVNDTDTVNVTGRTNKEGGDIIYPFDAPEFLTSWEIWKTYKKEQWKFTYKSISTEQGALTILSKLANNSETAVEIINQSIGMGWKGFFKLSENGKNNRSNSAAKTAANILEKRGLV